MGKFAQFLKKSLTYFTHYRLIQILYHFMTFGFCHRIVVFFVKKKIRKNIFVCFHVHYANNYKIKPVWL